MPYPGPRATKGSCRISARPALCRRGQPVPVVHHEPQRFPVQGGRADGPAGRRHRGGQGKVGLAGGQFGKAAVPGSLAEVELRLRVAAPECADQQRQRRLAERVLEGHGYAAADHLGLMPHQVKARAEVGERRLDVRQQGLGRRRQADTPPSRMSSSVPTTALARASRPAHGGLRNPEQFGGFGDVLRAAELGEQRKESAAAARAACAPGPWLPAFANSSVLSIGF